MPAAHASSTERGAVAGAGSPHRASAAPDEKGSLVGFAAWSAVAAPFT